MDPQTLAELHNLVNAQLMHHKAAQPRLDVISAAEQIVANKRNQQQQFVMKHKLEALKLQRLNSGFHRKKKVENHSPTDGVISSNTSIVSTDSLRLESSSIGRSTKQLNSSLPTTSNTSNQSVASSVDSSLGFSRSMPYLPSASAFDPSLSSRANRLEPIGGSIQSAKSTQSLNSYSENSAFMVNNAGSRSSSPPKLHRHGQFRRLASTTNDFASTAASVDSISTLATSPSNELIENVSKVFHGLYNQRNVVGTDEKRSGQFTNKLTPKVSLGSSYDYNKSINLVNKYIEEVEDLTITTSAGPAALLLDRDLLDKMQNGYFKELKSYDSIALYVQTRYIELKQYETGIKPTKTKAIVIADLVMKLCRILGRFAHVLEPLLWELFNSIFQGYAENEHNFTPDNFISELAKLNTFADMYHDTQNSLEDVNEELHVIQQGHNMKKIVKKFQTVRLVFDEAGAFIRDACFKVWKKYSKFRSRLKHIGRTRGLRYRFNLWRKYNRERDKRDMEDFTQELDRKIDRLNVLNNLIECHNVDQINKIVSNSVAAPMISSRVPSNVSTDDYRGRPSTKSGEKTKSKNPQDKFRQQKDILDGLNKKITRSLGSVTIIASPANSRQSSMEKVPSLRSISMTNSTIGRTASSRTVSALHSRTTSATTLEEPGLILEGQFSPRFEEGLDLPAIPETAQEDNSTMQVLEKTAILKAQILADYQDEMTQTPDDWMVDVREPVLGFLYPADEAQLRGNPPDHKNVVGDKEIKSNLPAIGERIPRKYEMNIYAAEELIGLIFAAKVADIKKEKDEREFSVSTVTLMEYTKFFMLNHYKLRRMCTKFYKELYACCVRDYRSRPRLELFATLCGYPLKDAVNPKYDQVRYEFMANLLYILFEGNSEAASFALSHRIIDREWVLDKIPLAYPTIYAFQNEHYQNLVYEVVDLPCVDLTEADISYKVNIDDLLLVLISYWDVEVEAKRKQQLDFDEDFDDL